MRDKQVISCNNYTWIGQNRGKLSRKAVRGSGGVGMLVRLTLFDRFKVKVLDSSYEGILWVKFQSHDKVKMCFLICICYLPPHASSRGDTSQEFFEKLSSQCLLYPALGIICLCGDFNTRCGNHQDVLELHGFPPRQILDYFTNSHGLQLIDFMRPLDLCMLNGRGKDHYTYISSLGCSVVDYCLVEKEDFDNFSNFEVTTVSDLERSLNYQSRPATDHSVLSWLLFSNTLLQNENDTTSHEDNESFSYNYKKIPPDFLQTCITGISLLSEAILSNSMNQTLLDEIYSKFCDIVKAEIQNKLPYIKRKFPSKKPWWNYSLNSARKECQRAQKRWLNCKGDREVKVAVHPRGPRKHCVISAYIFNEKSRVRLGTK